MQGIFSKLAGLFPGLPDGTFRTVKLVGCGVGLPVALMLAAGCARFEPHAADKYVYVTAKETYLRDRIAAVSNRTGTVNNGDKLVVLERARKLVKVRTADGKVGWIQEREVADQETADRFEALRKAHLKDPVVTTAAAHDDVYLHLSPGRETERFFRLAEGDTMSLLGRATVAKPVAPGAAPVLKPAAARNATEAKTQKAEEDKAAEVAAAAGPPMEDWWLVRDAKGETGWIYSRMIDVSEPEALSRYSEGQKIVGAYVLTNVEDPDSNMIDNGKPVTSIPEYVTVLAPFKAGLPYDFDQVRVFTWNLKKHRYETAFRERNIEGYLPVQIAETTDPYGHTPLAADKLPTFTYRVLAGDAPTPAPDTTTGLIKPAKTIAKTYRLEGPICHRILQPGTQQPAEAHPMAEEKKDSKKKKR